MKNEIGKIPLVTQLAKIASDKDLNPNQIANRIRDNGNGNGTITRHTVKNTFNRITKTPTLETVTLIADALEYEIILQEKE